MTHPSETAVTPSPDLSAIRARAENCRTYNFGMRVADQLAHQDVPELLAALDEAERTIKHLVADLDVRFEHSDHQSAKYWGRMRIAERALASLEASLAERVRLAQEQAWNEGYDTPASEAFPGQIPNPYRK